MKLNKNLYTKTGWEIFEKEFDKDQIVTTGSNFMIGNGYLGYRGTFTEWESDNYVATIVSDTYDMADGKWRELCNVPNGLYTKLVLDGEEVSLFKGKVDDYQRGLNFKYGIYNRSLKWISEDKKEVNLDVEKFASYNNLHLVVMNYKFTVKEDTEVTLITGIDGELWNINGEHLNNYNLLKREELIGIEATTVEFEDKVDVIEGIKITGKEAKKEEIIKKDKRILRKLIFDLEAGEEVNLEKVVAIYSSNDVEEPLEEAINDVQVALEEGYSELKREHGLEWDRIWEASDIKLKGDLESQTALRFNLYHNIICTPAHTDKLPIGARGLSCQAYQGAAFWDQEIFNMPMFLYTRPKVAKNILKYRYHTLDGARRKAKKLGYEGAYYAWISGKTGDELCPDFFFKDVLSGRPIRNHFNDWQIHISPDIAYSIKKYYDVTGDWEFIEKYGAEVIFEIARFLASHVVYKPMRERYEIIRVQGPDEYHENVDNNAFTNYQTYMTMETALNLLEKIDNVELERITEKIELEDKEIELWKDIKEKLYLPKPNEDKVLEQFDGYFDLETIIPAEKVIKRLQDEGEYYGWPNGITVFTQCIKQADVMQLFCLYPNMFDKDVIEANYEYYEPRTLHFSSLSLSSYSIVASNIDKVDEAYKNFKKSINVDLLNTNEAVSGGTFIGGIHTAACGAAWQMIVYGFAGMKVEKNKLDFNPRLPEKWDEVEFALHYQGKDLRIKLKSNQLIINSNEDNKGDLQISIGDEVRKVSAGQKEVFLF